MFRGDRQLARAIGLSAPSVAERIRRLEEVGVITGYSASLDPKTLGYPLAAWLRIRPIPGRLQKVVEILDGIDQIVECDRVTGEDCFIAKVHARSVEDLERVIDRIIPYAMTNTSIIQSSPITRRLLPVGDRPWLSVQPSADRVTTDSPVRPVTKATRADFEAFFSSPGAPKYCWCMVWRRTRRGGEAATTGRTASAR